MNLKVLSRVAVLSGLLSIAAGVSPAQVKQEAPSLSGTVVDAIDGAPFKNLRIWIFDEYSDTQIVVHPDQAGNYAVQLPEGYYFVLIGTGGYIPACKSIWVLPGKPIKYSVRLSPDHENMIY